MLMVKWQLKIKHLSLLFLVFGFLFVTVYSCWAAKISLENSQKEYYLDDVFFTNIWLNTEEEDINVVQVDLKYSLENLEVEDLSYGNSILNLWINEPKVEANQGTISFTGGVPGGYKGSKGLLGKIVFRTKQPGDAKIYFEKTSRVLLNDGFGTMVDLEVKGANFTILAEKTEAEDQWQKEMAEDKTQPEPFEIEINQHPSIFENKYFITFLTTDKQTGVDYYEVSEGEKEWRKAESPYLLENQSLTEEIKVRAVDKAGNEHIAVLPPQMVKPFKLGMNLIITLVFIGFIILYFLIKKVIKKQKK